MTAGIRVSSFVTSTILCHLIFLAHQACAEDVTTVIDDSNPDIKLVSGKWSHFKGSRYYNGTESLTRDAGATALYTFNGTSISVFGTECDPGGLRNETVSMYTVDGGHGSNHTVPQGTVCNQNFVKFYSSPPLPDGPHTLVITNFNQGSWFFLDYIEVTSPGNSSSASSPSGTSSSASSPSGTSEESTTKSSTKKIRAGAIVGIVVGVVAFLAFIVLGAVWWKRTKHRRTNSPFDGRLFDAEAMQPATLTPYLPPPVSLTMQSSGKGIGGNMGQSFAFAGSNPQTISTRADMPTASTGSSSQVTPLVQGTVTGTQHAAPVGRQYSATTNPPAYER